MSLGSGEGGAVVPLSKEMARVYLSKKHYTFSVTNSFTFTSIYLDQEAAAAEEDGRDLGMMTVSLCW